MRIHESEVDEAEVGDIIEISIKQQISHSSHGHDCACQMTRILTPRTGHEEEKKMGTVWV